MKPDLSAPAGPFWKLRVLLHARSFGRVFLRLFADARVPFIAKLAPVFAVIYLISPLDFDFVPIIGQVDDLIILMLMGRLFIRLCPADVVAEHIAAVEGRPVGRSAR